MSDSSTAADVVVVGDGMAGLVAGASAVRSGADVLVLEKGPRAGGSMYVSGGVIYTFDTVDAAREHVPRGDPELQALVVERLDECIHWLEAVGVDTREPHDVAFGSGTAIDPPTFTEHMVDLIRADGRLWCEAPMTGLVEEDGAVVGVEVHDRDEGHLTIRADSVVLATGGFQGNERLVEQYITDDAADLWLRANPWSTGDGLVEALSVGAKTTSGMGTFYGHNLPAPPAELSMADFYDAKQAYGERAIAVDRSGHRYTDESRPHLEVPLTQATAALADGRATYLLDHDLYTETYRRLDVGEMVDHAAELGGRVAQEQSLAALGDRLTEWGFEGSTAVETVRTFNDAMREGDTADLEFPRRNDHRTFETAPFHAVEVRPGITFTMGGLDVDGRMRVLHRGRSRSGIEQHVRGEHGLLRPIAGLYASGVDVGNIHHGQYMGGLSTALVTGRIAGENAADRANDARTPRR